MQMDVRTEWTCHFHKMLNYYTNSPNKCKFSEPQNAFSEYFVLTAEYDLLLPPSDCYCVFLFFTALFGVQLHLYRCLTGVRHDRGYLRHLPLYRPYLCPEHWLQAGVTHWHVKHEKNFPPNWFPSLSNWSACTQSTKPKTCVCDLIAGAKPCLTE